MQRLILLGLVATQLAACSLISDFGGYDFADPDMDQDSGAGLVDGGGAGGAGGDSGDGGDGGGGVGGAGGDSGVDSGGVVSPFMCMTVGDDDAGCLDCQTDDHCGTRVCESGMCVPCREDANCAAGVCVANACVECRSAANCGPTDVCVAGTCVPDRKPSGVWLSAGGGVTQSTNLKARISIAAPQPIGRAASATLKLTSGPGAGFPQ